MAVNVLAHAEYPSAPSDTGSPRSSDDDSFVLPSFAYEVPDDAFAPSPWEKKTKQVQHDNPRAGTAHAAHAQPAKALEKTVHKEDREHGQVKHKAGASVLAQRTPSSSNVPSSLLISESDHQATQPKPQPKPKPTPQLDLLTQLMVQGLPGLSSPSPPRRAQAQTEATQPPPPSALRVDAPPFVSHQRIDGCQQQQPPPPQQLSKLLQQPQPVMGTQAFPSQLSRALPSHMKDLAQLMAPPQPKLAVKPTADNADCPYRDLDCLMGAPPSKAVHQTSSTLSSSSLFLPQGSPSAHQDMQVFPPSSAANMLGLCFLGDMPPSSEIRPPSSSEAGSPPSPDLRLFSSPETSPHDSVDAHAPSSLRYSPQPTSDNDNLIPDLSPSSLPRTPQPQAESSDYPSTFSSYQNSSPGSPLALPSALYHNAHPPPSYHSNAESACQPNMLDPDKLDFDYLQCLLLRRAVFVRVEGPKNNHLRWTGESATSGYFGRQDGFKGLGPEAYEKAARAAGLDRPNWESQGYLWRSMDAHRWPDQGCVPEDSPWISATTNLEWAIWRTANILTSSSTVYMTFIKPTTERYSLPKPPYNNSKAARSLKKLTKGNSEVLFYGRIFAESIVARVKWTRTVSYGPAV